MTDASEQENGREPIKEEIEQVINDGVVKAQDTVDNHQKQESEANKDPDISNLLNGIALFIDDEVNDQAKDAYKLKIQIEDRHIPLITYTDIPDNNETFVDNLHGISFIILDWDLSVLAPDEKINGVNASLAQEESINYIIEFIRLLLDKTYCPIFIFSQESINGIRNKLDQNKITQSGFHPRILFEPKQKIKSDGALFSEIQNWLKNNPIITVLKTWEKAAQISKFKMFSTLEQKNTNWPKILWDTFKSGHTDQSHELTQILTNIFANHVILECDFNSSLFSNNQIPNEQSHEAIDNLNQPSINDIRSILQLERYITFKKEENKTKEEDVIIINAKPAPGDLFKEEETIDENGEKIKKIFYWLNIRAQCNLLHIDKPELYCIRGTILNESRILILPQNKKQSKNTNGLLIQQPNHSSKDVIFSQGQLHSRDDKVYVPFIINEKIIEFDFYKFKIKKFDDNYKKNRIGRILPPYITRIQQLFSAYMIREGLPDIPDAAIESTTEDVQN